MITASFVCLSSSHWSPVGMSRSNLPGVTSTGTSPMRVSSTWETSSTFPQRSSPPPCVARPALRPQGPGPRVSSIFKSPWKLVDYLAVIIVVVIFLKLVSACVTEACLQSIAFTKETHVIGFGCKPAEWRHSKQIINMELKDCSSTLFTKPWLLVLFGVMLPRMSCNWGQKDKL